ncbi:MAG: hypothetical protein KGI57_10380, partial [Hyphomicrobiales bacterium]|nr:hypothetical protein [Hyphomicrobiales bacterium]
MHFSHSFGFGAARSAALASVALSAVAIGAAFAQTAAPPTAAPGFSVRVFAASPAGASEPDSIAMVGDRAWIGYGDGGKPDGSGGAKSSIVEFSADGKALRTLTLAGHNDGLRLDPRSGKLWAIQNEDSDPNLVVIDPATGAMSAPYAFPATAHGGGYDDVTFKDGA